MAKRIAFIISTLFLSSQSWGAGKLLGTPSVSQLEGAGGGGIVAWAQLAGYASEDEVSGSTFCSRVDVDHYWMNVCGAQANLYNRIELSYARQTFVIPASNTKLKQNIIGAKIRLYGDIVYSRWPQLSLGLQYKKLQDPTVAFTLNAKNDSGTEMYLAASKLHLGAAAGYNVFWALTARHTQANQLGLLGHGSENSSKELLFEGSTALFINPHLALGMEFREKSNHLSLGEQHWRNIFIAWFPNKHVNVTAAWVDLGSIALKENQTGWYFSITGNL